jgi:hypothetical protein
MSIYKYNKMVEQPHWKWALAHVAIITLFTVSIFSMFISGVYLTARSYERVSIKPSQEAPYNPNNPFDTHKLQPTISGDYLQYGHTPR